MSLLFLGYGEETIKALLQYREYMTLDEIFTHLDLLHNLSNKEKGKTDLTSLLPALLLLFKQMLMEYDNSEMNIIITNILNNIVSKNMIAKTEKLPKTMVYADTATEVLFYISNMYLPIIFVKINITIILANQNETSNNSNATEEDLQETKQQSKKLLSCINK